MKNNYNDLPQLIVALDNKDDTANYVHINDVRDDLIYYCPCCKGVVKPRAYKKENDYQVQPHFYHESGGCSEESFVHYICKTWLFENGSVFIVDGDTFTVSDIETEKTLHTSFGDYRPDVIVETKEGKVFFFEIAYSSKKSAHYIPVWDELGNDVIEINAREFINQKHNNDIPEFKVIYSNGECYIKSYTKNDYDSTIARRKLEWKRQDNLNYKMLWEKLDWFWNVLCQYKSNKVSENDVISAFNSMDYDDQVWCYKNIKNKTCTSFKDQFKEIINEQFFDMLVLLQNDNDDIPGIEISCSHVSPLIYEVNFKSAIKYLDYACFERVFYRIKVEQGLLIKKDFQNAIDLLKCKTDVSSKKIRALETISNFEYVKLIAPRSHWSVSNYPFSELIFNITFHDYIHSPYIKEEIGRVELQLCHINTGVIEGYYVEYKSASILNLKNEQIKAVLMNNSGYRKAISKLEAMCANNDNIKIKVSSDYRKIWLLYDYLQLDTYDYDANHDFNKLDEIVTERFINKIKNIYRIEKIVSSLCDLVNSCKNKCWKIEGDTLFCKHLFLLDNTYLINFAPNGVPVDADEKYFKDILLKSMNELAYGLNGDIRLMEE